MYHPADMRMDMSWKLLTQLLQATSPAPVSSSSRFSHHLLGLLQIPCSGTRFPFQLNSLPLCPGPINARWLSLNRHSNQGLMRLIKSKLGPVCFFQQAKFPWFFFRISLTCHFVAHSLDHPKTSPKFAYKYKGKINKRSNRRQQAKEDIKINKKKIYAKTNYKVNKNNKHKK